MSQAIDFQSITQKLKDQLNPKASQWFAASMHLIENSDDLGNDLLNTSARARRLCLDTVFSPDKDSSQKDADQKSTDIPKSSFAHWDTPDWVRACLLSAALQHPQHNNDDTEPNKSRSQCIADYYRYGDEYEKASALKALLALDPQGLSIHLALNACRANSLQLFEAIALNNDFPSTHFPELNWNQLILKALFQDLNIMLIHGLKCRQNAKLSEMAYSYAQEQILAQRSPPVSIWLAMRLTDLTEGARHLFKHYASHPNTQHRDMIDRSIHMHEQSL